MPKRNQRHPAYGGGGNDSYSSGSPLTGWSGGNSSRSSTSGGDCECGTEHGAWDGTGARPSTYNSDGTSRNVKGEGPGVHVTHQGKDGVHRSHDTSSGGRVSNDHTTNKDGSKTNHSH